MESIQAVVRRVYPNGKKGPYALAREEGTNVKITFSLEKPVWNEDKWPEVDDHVVLSELRKKSQWRAESGRFFQPSDKRQSTKGNFDVGDPG